MAKRARLLLAALTLCAGHAAAQETKDEPREFRGMVWDAPFDEQRNAMSVIR